MLGRAAGRREELSGIAKRWWQQRSCKPEKKAEEKSRDERVHDVGDCKLPGTLKSNGWERQQRAATGHDGTRQRSAASTRADSVPPSSPCNGADHLMATMTPCAPHDGDLDQTDHKPFLPSPTPNDAEAVFGW
nr:hypothetical protein CFP56_08130 [Quercus suber]